MRLKQAEEKNEIRIGLVGSGSWAMALLKILLHNGFEPMWWVRRQEAIDFIKKYRHNPKYLSSVEINLNHSCISDDVNEVIDKSDIIILAVPSAYLADSLSPVSREALKSKVIVSAVKGMLPVGIQSVLEYMGSEFNVPEDKCAAIIGPCHAEEVARERMSYLTFSSTSASLAHSIAHLFNSRFIKTNVSSDLHGTEYAAVLKNVYAIAAGIGHGLGYGDNFQSVLVSNAMQEMESFLSAAFPQKRNLLETAYMGDLLVTAYSQYSRNRTFGNMVGKGYSIKSAQLEMDMVAEGYYGSKPIYALSKELGLQSPMIDAVYHILYDNVSPSLEFSLLASLLNQQIS